MNISEPLFQALSGQCQPKELDWLKEKSAKDTNSLSLSFVMVPRFIEKQELENEVLSQAASILPDWNWNDWTLDRLARVYLLSLCQERELSQDEYIKKINLLFDTAELNESVALYSAIPVLAYPEAWMNRATDAVRSNVGLIFDAIAFGNPYPKQYFSELAWNQLVLKCIFNDKPIHQIEGLEERNNEALVQTLVDFAHERWAANRRVPSQVWRLLVPYLNPAILPNIEKLIHSDSASDRLAAALVLAQSSLAEAKTLAEKYKNELPAVPNDAWGALEKPEPIYQPA
ncbi:EboA domain-containing protein [Aquirufa ecclesiirivi]|uniref:EboA domain-containing protein n=1 Tax=Aquirufa ecclesiirivi TaxID=2715124 RepID=UPI00140DF7A1|nr:EboA domain-containing protein [Aquirufa ecclesiirivi]NHC50233.1 hypothetical protein [Aquirufa ecclesiirivi]